MNANKLYIINGHQLGRTTVPIINKIFRSWCKMCPLVIPLYQLHRLWKKTFGSLHVKGDSYWRLVEKNYNQCTYSFFFKRRDSIFPEKIRRDDWREKRFCQIICLISRILMQRGFKIRQQQKSQKVRFKSKMRWVIMT